MKTNATRSLATLLVAIAATGAHASEMYGAAPESLDYAPTAAESRGMLLSRMHAEELTTRTDENPFPAGEPAAVDPLSKKKVDRVLVGPVFRARGYGTKFDYYRYVTFYNVKLRKERIYALPVLHEDCHDKSEIFGSYTYTHSYSATMSASVSVEGLGLSASMTETRTFATARNLRASGNMIADHVPYFAKQDWSGRTFVQTYTKKTGKTEFITRESSGAPLWLKLIFPILASERYPYAFSIKDADWTFSVERKVVSTCSTEPPTQSAALNAILRPQAAAPVATERSRPAVARSSRRS